MVSSSSSASSQAALLASSQEASSQKKQKVDTGVISPAEKELREKLAELFTSVDPGSLHPKSLPQSFPSSLTCDYLGKEGLQYLTWQPTLLMPTVDQGAPPATIALPETCSLSHIHFRSTAVEHSTAYPRRVYYVILLQDTAFRTMVLDARAAMQWIQQNGTSPAGDGKANILTLDLYGVHEPTSFSKYGELGIQGKKIVFKKVSSIVPEQILQTNLLNYSEKPGETLREVQAARMLYLQRHSTKEGREGAFLNSMALYLYDLGKATDNGFTHNRLYAFIGDRPRENQKRTNVRMQLIEKHLPAHAMVQEFLGDCLNGVNQNYVPNLRQANTHYKQAMELLGQTASDTELLCKLARGLQNELRYDEARPYLEQALKIKPSCPNAHTLFARQLLGQQNSDQVQAEFHLDQARLHHPQTGLTDMFYACMGRVHSLKNEFKQAKECFEKAIEVHKEGAGEGKYWYNANLALGELHLLQKEYKQAFDHLNVVWHKGNCIQRVFVPLVTAAVKLGMYDRVKEITDGAIQKQLYPDRAAVAQLFDSEAVRLYQTKRAEAERLSQLEPVREYEAAKRCFGV